MLFRKQGVPMRPIICDACQIRIDEDWTGPALEVKTHNGGRPMSTNPPTLTREQWRTVLDELNTVERRAAENKGIGDFA